MIVVIRPHTPTEEVEQVIREITELGYTPSPIRGEFQTVVAAIGDETTHASLESLTALPQVERVLRVQKRYKLTSRESRPEGTVIDVGGVKIGRDEFVLMAGPCSVESEEQLMRTAHAVKAAGATILRGGAYKPRTSPYSFQGMEEEGLKLLAEAREATGMPVVTEIARSSSTAVVERSAKSMTWSLANTTFTEDDAVLLLANCKLAFRVLSCPV